MIDRDDLNDHLFGDLDAESHARVEARMARDPELRARAAELSAMVEELEGVPQAAWEYVDSRTRDREVAMPRRGRRGWLARRPILIGGLAGAAAFAAVVLALVLGGSTTPVKRTVLLSALAGAPADSWATATITGSRHISVSVRHLPATDRRHHYELWLMTSPTDLVPVGSFRVGGDGRVDLSTSLPSAPDRYRYLDISLQADGSGTTISSDSLLRGATAPS
jgi:anti-sigma factor RsiW